MWFKFMILVHLCVAFPLKCPEPAQWTLRANSHCADSSKYFCLWNDLSKEYSENCTRSEFQQPGRKAVLRGGIDAVFCSMERYQPFPLKFYTNASTNCIFLKSFCNEEGQVLYDQGNRNTDTTCRCDYRQNYDFLVKPKNPCFCKPLQEECSCYLMVCSNSSQILSPDYKCISKTDLHPVTQCRAITNENDKNGNRSEVEKNIPNEDKISTLAIVSWKRYVVILLLFITGGTVVLVLLVLFRKRLWRYCFIAARYTSELNPIYCYEGEKLQLRLSVWSVDIRVEWLKDDNKLQQNEDMSIWNDGKRQCLTVPKAKLSDAGQYTLVAGNLQKHVTVIVKAMFTSEFNPVHCIEGKKLQLQCSVYSEDIHVEWFKDNTKMDQNEDLSIECEGTNHCLTIQHAKMSDAGQYTMVARNVLKYIPVTVKAMLCSDLNPILCIEGEKLQLKCSVYSDDIDVEWLKDEKKIEQNDNTLIENKGRYHCMTVQHAKLSDAGQYIIVAENVQKYITVTVQAMFTSEFNPVNCIEGEKFKLKCSVYSEDIFVKWLKDNTKIKQNENLSIESNGLYHCMTVLDAKLWDAGRYTMIARNVQKHITVTVQEMFESVCNQIYCNEGEKLQLKCTVCLEVFYVEWLFENEKKIFQNENTIIESEGKDHCLTFQKANLSNDGEYIVVAGNIQKRINVTVKDRKKLIEALDESFLSQRKAIFNWKVLKENITPVEIIDSLISEAFVEKDLWDQIKRYSRRYQLNSILSTAIKNIQTVDDYDKFEAIVVQCYPIIRLQTPNNDSDHPPNNNLIPVDRNTEKHIIANRELLEKELYPKDYIDGFLEWFILSLEDHEALRNKEHLRKQMAHSFLKTILQPDCIGKKSVNCLLNSFRQDNNTILNRISQLMNSELPNGSSTFTVDTELQQHMQMRDKCRHFVYSKWSHLKENFNPPNIMEELHSCGLVDEDRADIIRERPRREMVNSTLRNIVRRIDRPEMLEKLLSVLKKAKVFFCEELQDIVALKPLARKKEYDVEDVKCHLQLVEKQIEREFDLNYVDTFLELNVFDIDDHEDIWEAASGEKGRYFFEMISDIKYIQRGSIECLGFCLNNSKYREKIRKELAELLLSEKKPVQGKDTIQMNVRPSKEALHSMNTSSFSEGRLKITVDNKEAKTKLEDEMFKIAKSPENVNRKIDGLNLNVEAAERSSVVLLLKSDDGNVKLIVEKGIINGDLTSFIWNLLDDDKIKMHMSLEKIYNISVTLHSNDRHKEVYTDPKMRIIKANRELLEEEYDPLLLLNAVFEENVKKYKSVANLSIDSLAVIKQQFSEVIDKKERRERVKLFLNIAEEMIDADTLWELIGETANAFSVKKIRDDLNSEPKDPVSVEDGLVFEGNYEVWITKEDELSFKELKGSAEFNCQHYKEVYQSKEIHLPLITNSDETLVAKDKTLKKYDTQMGTEGKTSLTRAKLKWREINQQEKSTTVTDSHNIEIEFWKDQDTCFVETSVVKRISQILESKNCVLIVGEPGIGKSMMMHHIALQQHNTNAYRIIPCSRIRDILCHYTHNMRQIFVIDDICGRFTIRLQDAEHLLKEEDTLKRILEKGNTKIVATCRLDIYSDEIFQATFTVFTSSIFNLSAEYSKEDKLTIGTKYLTETSIQLLRDYNEPFTPLMCYLYSKNENFNLTDFCQCPYETYRNEWQILQSIDPYKYCALFLCVLQNGIIKESFFDINNENINIDNKALKTTFDVIGLNPGTSNSTMKHVLDRMIGTYLRKTKNEYRVIHDKMFDFMCCYFGNKDTFVRGILRSAHIEVVNERTQLQSINEQHCKFTIIVSMKCEQDYFERIKNEILLGKLNQCFCNAQMKHAKYRALFLKVLESIDFDQHIEHPIIQDSIITSCFRGYIDIAQYLISKEVDLDKGYSHFTPLTAACWTGTEEIVQLLIEKGGDVNQVDGMSRTALTASCGSGNEKIVQLLINKGIDVNQVDGKSRTPLTAACGSRNEEIVQLLIDKGSDVNQADGMRETPLTAAIYTGNEKIVHLLIDKVSDVNQEDGMRETPLTAAIYTGNEKIVHLLIDKGSDVNQVSGMRRTPLTDSIYSGNTKIVQLIIDKGSDVNQLGGMRRTPLTAACSSGQGKIVQLLIDKECDVNQVDGTRRTPLTTAIYSGNEKIVQLLIDKGSDVNQVDGMRETPLIAACEKRNEKIVQLLINNGCDVNKVNGEGETPLTAARRRRNKNIAQLLIDKGCDI